MNIILNTTFDPNKISVSQIIHVDTSKLEQDIKVSWILMPLDEENFVITPWKGTITKNMETKIIKEKDKKKIVLSKNGQKKFIVISAESFDISKENKNGLRPNDIYSANGIKTKVSELYKILQVGDKIKFQNFSLIVTKEMIYDLKENDKTLNLNENKLIIGDKCESSIDKNIEVEFPCRRMINSKGILSNGIPLDNKYDWVDRGFAKIFIAPLEKYGPKSKKAKIAALTAIGAACSTPSIINKFKKNQKKY